MVGGVGLRERKKARTRESLEAAALDLFARQGFDATTIEEIADACEVSPRTFFRYFPTKEAVLFGDGESRCAALVDALSAQPADVAPLDALHAAMLDLARSYRELVDARMGRVRGKVASAVKMGDAQVAALKKQLEALTQRSVVLETSVDASLLGGVVATVGSHQFDGSLRSQLNELGRTLTQR